MKFERNEIGEVFSRLRAAVPDVRAAGGMGILLKGSSAVATNLELSVKAEVSDKIEQAIIVPPRGVEFVGSAMGTAINIDVDGTTLSMKSGTARARLNTVPYEQYPELPGPGADAKHCTVKAEDLSWAISKVRYAVAKDPRKPAHQGLCFTRNGSDTLEICALDGYRIALCKISCAADGDFRFVLPAASAKAIETLEFDGDVEIVRDRAKAVFSCEKYTVTTRLIAEPFLDYSGIIEDNYDKTECNVDRRELIGVLNRVKLARPADGKEKVVLVVDWAQNSGRASMKSSIAQMNEEFSVSGNVTEPLRMGFNIDFLLEALKSMDVDSVKVQIKGALSPVKLNEEGYTALVLPVRIRE